MSVKSRTVDPVDFLIVDVTNCPYTGPVRARRAAKQSADGQSLWQMTVSLGSIYRFMYPEMKISWIEVACGPKTVPISDHD